MVSVAGLNVKQPGIRPIDLKVSQNRYENGEM